MGLIGFLGAVVCGWFNDCCWLIVIVTLMVCVLKLCLFLLTCWFDSLFDLLEFGLVWILWIVCGIVSLGLALPSILFGLVYYDDAHDSVRGVVLLWLGVPLAVSGLFILGFVLLWILVWQFCVVFLWFGFYFHVYCIDRVVLALRIFIVWLYLMMRSCCSCYYLVLVTAI